MSRGPRRVRVLVVAPSISTPGGQSIQAELIRRRFEGDLDIDVRLQEVDPRFGGLVGRLQRIKYVRTAITFPAYCVMLFARISRADVVHVFSASYLSFVLAPTPAILIARMLRKPVLLNYHSGEAEDHLRRWPSAVRMLRLATEVVVPSPFLIRVFSAFGIKTTAVSNAVDLSSFVYRQRRSPAPRILINRSFERHYNVTCAIRSFAIIQEHLPGARLTVAGDGPMRPEIERLVSDLQLRNTQMVGRVPAHGMPALYDQHDIWLNASLVDNMPLSILESFASGAAVVSSSAGGIRDLVRHGETGLLSKDGSAEDLAQLCLGILADPQRFARLTDNANRECEKYTWRAVAPEWKRHYAQLAAGARS
jgi:L-malate glycosyltransferase